MIDKLGKNSSLLDSHQPPPSQACRLQTQSRPDWESDDIPTFPQPQNFTFYLSRIWQRWIITIGYIAILHIHMNSALEDA